MFRLSGSILRVLLALGFRVEGLRGSLYGFILMVRAVLCRLHSHESSTKAERIVDVGGGIHRGSTC